MSGEHGTCWRCRWFDREPDDPDEDGYCRRYPPTAMPDDESDALLSIWPGVGILDWCGEFIEHDEHR